MTSPLHSRYDRATLSCALFHLDSWTAIEVSGPDSAEFLNRIGTADIRSLQAGDGGQTLFLKGDGRLVADCIILRKNESHFVLLMSKICAQELWDHLDRFHFSENLTLAKPASEGFVGMVSGDKRGLVCSFLKDRDEGDGGVAAEVSIAPSASRVFTYLPETGFQAVGGGLYQSIADLEGVIGDSDLFEVIRIEDSIPEFGRELSNRTIPLEAGLKPAISFTKGCFPGQEVVARINNLGHPANVLAHLKLPQTADSLVGRKLLVDSKDVGYVTSTCYSPARDSVIGLAYLKWNAKEAGLQIAVEEETESAEILFNVYGNA